MVATTTETRVVGDYGSGSLALLVLLTIIIITINLVMVNLGFSLCTPTNPLDNQECFVALDYGVERRTCG